MDFKEQIKQTLADSATKLGLSTGNLSVTFSNRPELCDYQCNYAMMMAKQVGQRPFDLAEKIVNGIGESENFELAVVMPGFINIKVKEKALAEYGDFLLGDKNLGVPQVEKSRLVFFDYGGANVAKELHVGHLRSPIVGEALKRLHLAMGDKTLADVHLGDFGLQMGLTLLQLHEDGYLDEFFKADADIQKLELPNVTLDVLNEEYPKASKRKDVDEDFKANADEITLFIQQRKEPYFSIYNKIRALSVAEIEKNYTKLNAEFDFYYGESDAYALIDETVQVFVDKGLARESEGALVVDVAREGEHIPIPKKSEDEPQRYKNPMPPAIIKKYNGGDLYATTDIATILIRNRDYAPDEIVYVTDNRQGNHFEQVFRCCKLAGVSPEEQKLTHVAFGTMNGQDGKPFKTRSGETVKFKDVLGLVVSKAAEKLASNGIEGDDELARKIGVGAMKFGDLSVAVGKDYVFDIDKFLAFDGKTGPYIQYTIARINSILAKAGFAGGKVKVSSVEERNILLAVLKLCSAYQVCYDSYSMNALCLAAFDLASEFSTLYNNHKILSETDNQKKEGLLSICVLVKKCLEKALWTLGIDSVEKM
ncbi:MAG: arginine--tRNA ligase [Clostridia bacterium]|nr:arginine--tRNA ligase [Clostridia bacterium]